MEKKRSKKQKPLNDVVSKTDLNVIAAKDRKIMLTAMVNLIEDLNSMEIEFSAMDIKPGALLRLHQLINVNRTRARKVIWGLTIARIKESDTPDKFYLDDVEKLDKVQTLIK